MPPCTPSCLGWVGQARAGQEGLGNRGGGGVSDRLMAHLRSCQITCQREAGMESILFRSTINLGTLGFIPAPHGQSFLKLLSTRTVRELSGPEVLVCLRVHAHVVKAKKVRVFSMSMQSHRGLADSVKYVCVRVCTCERA